MGETGGLMLMNDSEYLNLVRDVKEKIAAARYRAMQTTNSELMMLYWDIGTLINEHRERGSGFVQNLARDIRRESPSLRGFSARNLTYMATFAANYPDRASAQTLSAQLSWSHVVLLLDKVPDQAKRDWYITHTIESGWSVRRLESSIYDHLYERQALPSKTTNFADRLESPQRELAQDMLRDPYIFDFITARDGLIEREIEAELVRNISKFLIELGNGFAFVGEQYRIQVEGEDFYIDLLFYHLKLRCYVVVELKAGPFRPELLQLTGLHTLPAVHAHRPVAALSGSNRC